MNYGDSGGFNKFRKRIKAVGKKNTASGYNHGFAGITNHYSGTFDLSRMSFYRGTVSFEGFAFFNLMGKFFRLYILGYIDKHRSPSSRSCEKKGFFYKRGNLFRLLNEIIMFRYGDTDSGYVHLLKRVISYHRSWYLASDCHYGRGVHVSRCYTRHQVCRAWTAGGHTDSCFTRNPGIAVGHMSGALFVFCKNPSYLRTPEG